MSFGNQNWIQEATSRHKGAFTKKAKAAGKSVEEFAQEHVHSPGTIGQQARLAHTLERINKFKGK